MIILEELSRKVLNLKINYEFFFVKLKANSTYVRSNPASQPSTILPSTGPAASVKLLTNLPITYSGGLKIIYRYFFDVRCKTETLTFLARIVTTKDCCKILLSVEDITLRMQNWNESTRQIRSSNSYSDVQPTCLIKVKKVDNRSVAVAVFRYAKKESITQNDLAKHRFFSVHFQPRLRDQPKTSFFVHYYVVRLSY